MYPVKRVFHEKQFLYETLYLCVMTRKKWTPKTEVTDALLKFREKRKWQIALRRYILEGKWGSAYAPYFGLDTLHFRKWIELQFDEEMQWDTFSETWQFDHIVPVAYFDFDKEADLRLCWNFINIRVEKTNQNKNRGNRIDVLGAKAYFEALYARTQYAICKDMILKIEEVELSEIKSTEELEGFIVKNKEWIDTISGFSAYEYSRLNEGISIEKIVEERGFLNKF